ncbi:MAG: DUF72 domain-containing protein [Homavirus sp.]|uniref:DUF72 domain-containing protein n=1 Tax=Homavirus sp. TaxID=2487769 RepID=A0A3G5A4T1_9VIRU|nr:MAG: DUF72 domain-containing protein [Homavirus sp.]
MNKYIGTSGYNYELWKGSFYPHNISSKNYLAYYSKFFNSVEINYTFYRMPSKKTVTSWYNTTPSNFKFCIKVHNYITHYKKLHNIDSYLKEFLLNLKPLKDKLACLLFQFPKQFVCSEKNLTRLVHLSSLLKRMVKHITVAVEFRHPSWSKIIGKLNELNFVVVSSYYNHIGFSPLLSQNISNTIYIRLHGGKKMYVGRHSTKVLGEIKKVMKNRNIHKCFVYFNNTDSVSGKTPDAIHDALTVCKYI